jgi:hypothetical protein
MSSGAIVLCLLARLATAAAPEPTVAQGVGYLNGGIGQEERQTMLEQRPNYNLLLMFANRGSGEFRADVDVAIQDGAGVAQLAMERAGPLLYVQLPPGQYQLTARAEGKGQTKQVTLSKTGQHELVLYWDSVPPATAP